MVPLPPPLAASNHVRWVVLAATHFAACLLLQVGVGHFIITFHHNCHGFCSVLSTPRPATGLCCTGTSFLPQSEHSTAVTQYASSLQLAVASRYVTPGAFIEAAEEFGIPRAVAMRNWDGCIQARAALFLPGGRIARELARNPTVLIVNDTAFAHGGLLPIHGEHNRQDEAKCRTAANWARQQDMPACRERQLIAVCQQPRSHACHYVSMCAVAGQAATCNDWVHDILGIFCGIANCLLMPVLCSVVCSARSKLWSGAYELRGSSLDATRQTS